MQEAPILEIDGYKLYLKKIRAEKKQTYELKLLHLKSNKRYILSINQIQDLPQKARHLFKNLQEFIKILEYIINQRKKEKDKTLLTIGPVGFINIKISFTIQDKIKNEYILKLQLFPSQQSLQTLNFKTIKNQIDQLQKRINEISQRETKSKDGMENNLSKVLNSPLLRSSSYSLNNQEAEDQTKKNKKEQKKSSKQMQKKNFQNSSQKQKDFIIEEKKITINQPSYRIEIILNTNRAHMMSVLISINSLGSNMSYTGQLTDVEVVEYLQSSMKYKNSKQVFQEIRKNAKNKNPDTVKVNEKQNKLEILLKNKNSKDNLQQQPLFAQIDIKPIKLEFHQQNQNSANDPIRVQKSQKSVKDNKKINKDKIIGSVKQALMPKKDEHKKTNKVAETQNTQRNKSTPNEKNKPASNSNDQIRSMKSKLPYKTLHKQSSKQSKQDSEISFKNKTPQKPKKLNLNASCIDPESFMNDSMTNMDYSMMALGANRKQPKSSKGLLINKQFDSWIIKQKTIKLKKHGVSCALFSKKLPKRLSDYEFSIKIKKISNLFIIGVAGEQVGNQNTFINSMFTGYDPISGILYQNGTMKDLKVNQIKQLKENSTIRVRVNLKSQMLSWSYQRQGQDSWRLLKECLIPKYMGLKDLYPTVFLKNGDDKVQFITGK